MSIPMSELTIDTVIGEDHRIPFTHTPASTPLSRNITFANFRKSLNFGVNVSDVRAFGAYSNGTYAAVTTAAIQSAIDDAQARNGVVYFPMGTYLVNDTLDINDVSALTVLGDSQQWGSIIKRSTDYGDTIYISANGANIEFGNLHFQTTVDTDSGAHLHINDTVVRINNCYLDGQFGGIWLEGRSLEASRLYVSAGYLWAARKFLSYGLKVSKSLGTYPDGYARLSDFEITGNPNLGTLDRGIDISSADGIILNNGHIGFTYAADMYVEASPANTQLTGIHATQVWFDAMNDNSTEYTVQFAGTSTGISGAHRFTGCEFSPCANSNLKVGDVGSTNYMVNACMISGAGLHGIDISSDRVILSGNQIGRNNRLVGVSADINIGANVNQITIVGNQLGVQLCNIAESTPAYNINIEAGTGDYIKVLGNSYLNATVSAIHNHATGVNNSIETP